MQKAKLERKGNRLLGFKNMFKGLDLYGEPVTLLYKGEEKFTTMIGATVSLLLLILIVAYSVIKADLFITRADPDMNTLTFARNLDKEAAFNPFDSGFDFAIGFNGIWIPPDIGTLEVYQRNLYFPEVEEGNSNRVWERELLELVDCGTEFFRFPNQDEVVTKGIDKYKCIQNKNGLLKGTWFSRDF